MRGLESIVAAACGVVALMGGAGVVIAGQPERTLPMDPVELIAGRETPGREDLSVLRDGFTYLFATPENKASFERTPEKFEAADGGACGRMGALSGLGDARRYTVHEGRLFFFASDACRKAFLKNPSAFIEGDDPPATGDADAQARGVAIVDRWIAWAGGEAAVRNATSYRESVSRQQKTGDTTYQVTEELAFRLPASFLKRETWNQDIYTTLATPSGGAMGVGDTSARIADARARAMRRFASRHPLVIMRGRFEPGFAAIADGQGQLGEVKIEYVRVSLHGATTRLGIEAATGRLVTLAFRGREGTMSVGEVVRTATVHATVGGLRLPSAWTTTVDGKDRPVVAFDTQELNPALPDADFTLPQ